MSDSLQSHGLQNASLPYPSVSPGVCSNSCLLSWWSHPNNLSSVTPFSSCPQSFPGTESFPVSWLFSSGSQSIGSSASASVLPMTIQGWFPLGLIGLISLLPKGLSIQLWHPSTTIQKNQLKKLQIELPYDPTLTFVWLMEKIIALIHGLSLAKWCFCFLIHCVGLL